MIGCQDATHLIGCGNFSCPPYTLKCPDDYCIPLHSICNDIEDCPQGDDEVHCDHFQCPAGSYKCVDSKICVDPKYICDGVKQCPFHDDEMHCDISCPNGCVCKHYDVSCNSSSSEHLKSLHRSTRSLNVSGLQGAYLTIPFDKLRYIGLLDMSWTNTTVLAEGKFRHQKNLLQLDVRNNRFKYFTKTVFRLLVNLQILYSDQYTLCCLARSGDRTLQECLPEENVFSSCKDLLQSVPLRVFAWFVGMIAFGFNLGVIISRLKHENRATMNSDHFLILMLAVTDFLVSIYLLVVASADAYYGNNYIGHDILWRDSRLCTLIGVFVTISKQTSMFIMAVMSVTRSIVIAFPLKLVRFKVKQMTIILLIGVSYNLIFAILPAFELSYFGKSFYGQNSLCLPLNVRHDRQPGWEFSLFLFCILNSIYMVLMTFCYSLILISSRGEMKVGIKSRKQRGSYKLFFKVTLILTTNMLSWIPIFVISFVGVAGIEIENEVNAWIIVIVLPFTSAINPWLYSASAFQLPAFDRFRMHEEKVGTKFKTLQTMFLTSSRIFWSRIEVPSQVILTKADRFTEWEMLDHSTLEIFKDDVTAAVKVVHDIESIHGSLDLKHVGIIANVKNIDGAFLMTDGILRHFNKVDESDAPTSKIEIQRKDERKDVEGCRESGQSESDVTGGQRNWSKEKEQRSADEAKGQQKAESFKCIPKGYLVIQLSHQLRREEILVRKKSTQRISQTAKKS
ncbi:G-protein coupled receptor GRL101-like isoform X2 [Ptychodera flava]|uniref:G-protein coupled receptor GRL101-like isoform X2 n=1 Tax=Ptychodera flava TaxID=63121 RepID=UPI00396A83E8